MPGARPPGRAARAHNMDGGADAGQSRGCHGNFPAVHAQERDTSR